MSSAREQVSQLFSQQTAGQWVSDSVISQPLILSQSDIYSDSPLSEFMFIILPECFLLCSVNVLNIKQEENCLTGHYVVLLHAAEEKVEGMKTRRNTDLNV